MHQKDLRRKLILGTIRAFRENEFAKRATGGKNRAFVENQCAEGTEGKVGHFG